MVPSMRAAAPLRALNSTASRALAVLTRHTLAAPRRSPAIVSVRAFANQQKPPTTSDLFTVSTVHHVEDDAELRDLITKNTNKLTVIDWSAAWCAPCRIIGPVYDELSQLPENKDVCFIKVDIDSMPEASSEARVTAVPTFHFIKNNQMVAVLSGADEQKIRQLIEKHR